MRTEVMSDFSWEGKKVLLTGGTGFIGTHLARSLQALGAKLLLLEHIRPAISGVEIHKSSIANLDATFESQVLEFQPEVVFHLAAQPLVSVAASDVCATIDANVLGTTNLLCVCKDIGSIKSFVHVSTDKVYGNINPITKDSIPQGVEHPYNVSKLAADAIAQMYSNFFDMQTVIIRNANVYGPGDLHFDRIVPRTIAKVFSGEQPLIRGDGSNTRDYVYITDLIEGYLRAAELPYTRKITLLNLSGFNHTVLDIVDAILLKMNRVDLAPIFEKQWRGEIPHQHIKNDLAKDLIGWNPKVDITEGVDRVIPWYVSRLTGEGRE